MKISIGFVALLTPTSAFAQTAAPAIFDFTALAISLVGGAFTVIGAVATTMINNRMKDTQAAAVLDKAITNSLGAVQQAIDSGLPMHHLQETISVSPSMAAGVQYAMDHAGAEMARLGITPQAVADKITARIGLVHAQTAGNAPTPDAPKT